MITRQDLIDMGYVDEDVSLLDDAVSNVNAQGWDKNHTEFKSRVKVMVEFTLTYGDIYNDVEDEMLREED